MTAAKRLKPELADGMHLRGSAYGYEYIDAINYSTLKECARSPKHYRHALLNRKPATDSMRRGSLVHTAVMEPDRLPLDYAFFLGERRGKVWSEFKEHNKDRAIVTEKEYEVALRIRDAVRGDAVAGPLVDGGLREPTLLWHDDASGLRCKGRPDLVRDDHVIVDLKTTRCAREFEFARDVAKYSYHVQAAFYSDGYQHIVMKEPRYCIVAVESVEPYDVVVYDLTETVLGPGRDEYVRLLSMVRRCREDDVWPGYALGCPMRLELPPWARTDENDIDGLGLEF